MIPNVSDVAKDVAERLSRDVVAKLTGFEANNVAMGAAMIGMISEHWDKAAADLVEENANMIALLDQGAAAGFGPFGGPFEAPLADLRLSALGTLNARLRAALIELHAAVEQAEQSAARAVEDAIWTELARSTERRRISAANF